MIITFEELRRVKDRLPAGSMQRISDELSVDIETVRNYFGGTNFSRGKPVGIHYEKGAFGGIVKLDNPEIFKYALRILEEPKEVLV